VESKRPTPDSSLVMIAWFLQTIWIHLGHHWEILGISMNKPTVNDGFHWATHHHVEKFGQSTHAIQAS